jgi:tetratricopeptide (TPR) repeat protein
MKKKLTSPEHMTRASEGNRALFDTMVASIPVVGSGLQRMLTYISPSKRDRQVAGWHNDATETLNDHSVKLEQVASDLSDMDERMDLFEGHIRTGLSLSGANHQPPAATQFDGELAIYREMVEGGNVRTALTYLEKRFGNADLQKAFPATIVAQAVSLMGICARDLGDEAQSAALFREAYARDPANPKLRSNAIVGLLMEGDVGKAYTMAREAARDLPGDARIVANLVYASTAAAEALDPERDIDPSVRFAEEVLLALVSSRRADGDSTWRDEALRVVARYPGSELAQRLAAEAAVAFAIEAWEDAEKRPPAEVLDRASRGAEILAEHWSRRKESQRAFNEADYALLNNALVGCRLSGALHSGVDLVEANLPVFDVAPEMRALAGVIALEAGRFDLLGHILSVPFQGDVLLRVEKALHDQDFKDALAHVEKNQDDEGSTGWTDLTVLRHCLQGALQTDPDVRRSEVDAALKAAAGNVRHLTTVARFARRLDIPDISDAAYRAALDTSDNVAFEDRLNLCSEARARRDHFAVIALLEPIIDPTRSSDERTMLANAYAASEPPLAQGLEFFKMIHKGGAAEPEIERSEGFFHLRRRMPAKAVLRFRNVLASLPNDLRVLLALWQALEMSTRHDEARGLIVDADVSALEGSDEDKMALAQLRWRYGDSTALDLAYDVASNARENPDVCLKYIGFFFGELGGEDQPKVEEPDSVSIGVWARARKADGEIFEFLVAEQPDFPRGQFTTANPIVAGVIGKKAGESFTVNVRGTEQTWSVEEIRSRHLLLCHEIMTSFQKHFPENGGLYSVSVQGEDLSPVLDVIRRRRERADTLVKTYQEKHLPLGIPANLGSMTSIEFAIGLAQSGAHVVNALGTGDEQEYETGIAKRERRRGGVVLDTYTAWFLAEEDLLELAKVTVGRLVLPRSAIDEIDTMSARLAPGEGPRLVVSFEAGQYVKREISPEDLRAQQARLRLMKDRLLEHTEIVGVEVGPTFPTQMFPVLDLVGEALDVLVVAQREGLALMSADLHLRKMARESLAIASFGLKGLFRLAQADGRIDRRQHSQIVLKMARHAHAHVPVNALVLFDVFNADDTETLYDLSAVARYLGTDGAEPVSHMNVAKAFLGAIWEPIRAFEGSTQATLIKKQRATGIILRDISRLKKVHLRVVIRWLFSGSSAGSPELDYVEQWLKGHFLLDAFLSSQDAS